MRAEGIDDKAFEIFFNFFYFAPCTLFRPVIQYRRFERQRHLVVQAGVRKCTLGTGWTST